MKGLEIIEEPLKTDSPLQATIFKLKGFIDSTTFMIFEKRLDEAFEKQIKNIIIDCSQLEYINSTGIGHLIKCYDTVKSYNGNIILLHVHKDIGQVMQLLGLFHVIPVLKDEKECIEYILEGRVEAEKVEKAPVKEAVVKEPSERPKYLLRFEVKDKAIPPNFNAFLLTPQEDFFTDILKMRLEKRGGRVSILKNCNEGLNRIADLKPDLVILESVLTDSENFVSKLKRTQGTSVPVIKIYPRGGPIEKGFDFKIWEDDFLVEPFEVLELFALSEAELACASQYQSGLMKQLHFSFASSQSNIEKGVNLGREFINSLKKSEDQTIPVQAAFQEAVDNAARHGNRFNPDKKIDVILRAKETTFEFFVENEGNGFDYDYYINLAKQMRTADRARISHRAGKTGGLGIKLMLECLDTCEYSNQGRKIHGVKIFRV